MSCATHPDVPATYRCDGCARLLCADCVVAGHRLLTCPDCGELAVSVAAKTAVTAPQLAENRRLDRPYSLLDALSYVFRGRGLYVFGSYLGVLAVLGFLGIFPLVGCIAWLLTAIFVLIVLTLVPGALFAITRTTAKGDNELPDWPDFSAFGERLAEVFDFVVIGLISALPLVAMVRLAGCSGWGQMPAHCWLVLVLGWFLAMTLWVPAFCAVAVFQEGWLAIRLDLHLRALFAGGFDLVATALMATVLVVLGQALSTLLAFLPLVGVIASAAAGMYGWFTAAHLVGLYYRRRRGELEGIYGPS